MTGYAKSKHAIPLVHLSNYLEGVRSTKASDKAFHWSEDASLQIPKSLNQFTNSWQSDTSGHTFTSSSAESELSACFEAAQKLYDMTAISNTEKIQILAIIDLLCEVVNQQSASAYNSLDEPGRRYL